VSVLFLGHVASISQLAIHATTPFKSVAILLAFGQSSGAVFVYNLWLHAGKGEQNGQLEPRSQVFRLTGARRAAGRLQQFSRGNHANRTTK
jgi:hypothetical protein